MLVIKNLLKWTNDRIVSHLRYDCCCSCSNLATDATFLRQALNELVKCWKLVDVINTYRNLLHAGSFLNNLYVGCANLLQRVCSYQLQVYYIHWRREMWCCCCWTSHRKQSSIHHPHHAGQHLFRQLTTTLHLFVTDVINSYRVFPTPI